MKKIAADRNYRMLKAAVEKVEADKPPVVPKKGPFTREHIEAVAEWNKKYDPNRCPSCGKNSSKWFELTKRQALRDDFLDIYLFN